MGLIVQKYGGSSLKSSKHIRRAAERIARRKRAGNDVVVVVSAMGRATDFLVRLAHRTVQHPHQRELDMLMTAGERVSMALMAMSLEELGVPAISFTGSQSGILTTGHHNNARITDIRPIRIRESMEQGRVPIVAGFQGVSPTKDITTLGRGGSDTTAVALAAKLGADCCEIFTDVDGLFTADPRLVPHARLLRSLPFPIAVEMGLRGAKMHPRSLQLAGRYGVRIRIASNQAKEGEGTMVHEAEGMEQARFQAVATKDGYDWFHIKGSGQTWLTALDTLVPAAMTLSEEGGQLLVEAKEGVALAERLENLEVPFERRADMCLVSVVGSLCREGLVPVLGLVHSQGLVPTMVETTPHSIAMVFPQACKQKLAQSLHDQLVQSL